MRRIPPAPGSSVAAPAAGAESAPACSIVPGRIVSAESETWRCAASPSCGVNRSSTTSRAAGDASAIVRSKRAPCGVTSGASYAR
ncbi:MAG TPA: hypothetical protein VGD01_09245 [Candidatus Elarobacter sp.]